MTANLDSDPKHLKRNQRGSIEDQGDRWRVRYRVEMPDAITGKLRRPRLATFLWKLDYPSRKSARQWLSEAIRIADTESR